MTTGGLGWTFVLLSVTASFLAAILSWRLARKGSGGFLARGNAALGILIGAWVGLDFVDNLHDSEHVLINCVFFAMTMAMTTGLVTVAAIFGGFIRRMERGQLFFLALPSLVSLLLALLPMRKQIFQEPNGELQTWMALVATGLMTLWAVAAVLFWLGAPKVSATAWTRLPAVATLLFTIVAWTIVFMEYEPIGSYGNLGALIPLAILFILRGEFVHAPPPALRVLVETLPDAVVAFDVAGRPSYLNARARRLAGLDDSPDAAALRDSLVPGWGDLEAGATVFANGSVLSLRRVDIPGQGRAIVLRDVSDAYAAAERAEAAVDAQSDFIAAVSHELRTPLGGILGLAGLLRSSPLNDDQRGWAVSIEDCATRLGALVSDVLDLAKLDADRFTLAPVPTDVAALLRDAAGLHSVAGAAKGVSVRIDGADEPFWRLADPLRLRQIADNLLGNAVKFTPIGEILVVLRDREGAVEISIADRGPGVPFEKRETVFERYRQVDAAISGHYGGTGLGLPIARRLARQMDGDVTVHDGPDGGAIFRVRLALPVAQAALPVSEGLLPGNLNGVRVLLVEDDPVLALVGRTVLERAGASVEVAGDGVIAVERCRETRYDAVLMDMQLPGLSGPEAARAIREDGYLGPIAALTANARPADRDECRAAGMDVFLTKPITRDALLLEMGRLVAPTGPSVGTPGC